LSVDPTLKVLIVAIFKLHKKFATLTMFLNKNALATFFKKRQQHDTDKKRKNVNAGNLGPVSCHDVIV